MPVGEAVEPPFGYFDYCHRFGADCSEFGVPGNDEAQAAINTSYWDLVFSSKAEAQPGDERLSVSWAVADLTSEQWREVAEINLRVNEEITSVADAVQYGRRDFWSAPFLRRKKTEGDCEDYVLAKRRELIALGVPEGALSIAIGRTPRREVHAVLLIATPAGEYVLDNRSPWVSRWYDLNYRWERRQVPGSQRWARVRA
ncbi:MAG: transglutaminase-like cysteine peptidase [Phenylobacterium sp.]|uniref:transglutaminase-like cysteine peptidase n=1 Tax=Phenylobacterium sp. TaxID=1871053 RepID=UPI00391D555C